MSLRLRVCVCVCVCVYVCVCVCVGGSGGAAHGSQWLVAAAAQAERPERAGAATGSGEETFPFSTKQHPPFTLPFQSGDHVPKVRDVKRGDSFIAALMYLQRSYQPQQRRAGVCVSGKARGVEPGRVHLMMFTFWQLNTWTDQAFVSSYYCVISSYYLGKKITATVIPSDDRDFSELSPRKRDPSPWVRESDSILFVAIGCRHLPFVQSTTRIS